MSSGKLASSSPAVAAFLCFLPASYFLGIALYAAMNFSDFAQDTPRLIRFVIGPFVLFLIFAVIAFVVTPRIASTIGLMGVSLLAGLFAFELFLTMSALSSASGLVGLTNGRDIKKLNVEKSLPPTYGPKKLNTELGVAQLSDAVLGGLPNRNVLMCSQEKKPVVYTADRYGFNNIESVYDRPIRVMVLGDSFVEGICLKPGNDFVSQLRKLIPGSVAIGMRATGPLFELAMLGRYGPQLQPEYTFFAFFSGNDWENLSVEKRYPWLKLALDPGAKFGPAVLPSDTIARSEKIVANWWNGNKITVSDVFWKTKLVRNFLALHQTTLQLGLHYPKYPPAQPLFKNILTRAKAIARTWGGKIGVVYIPAVDRYHGVMDRDFIYDQLRLKIREAGKAADVPVIDLVDVFARKAKPESLYAGDAHFNAAGASVAAGAIASYVLSQTSSDSN